MPVTKQRQAAGSFSIQLNPNVPRSITDAFAIASKGFGHICVLPAAVDTTGMTRANIFSLSIFTGVYRKESGDTRLTNLEGAHASIWLGDEDGKGELHASTTLTQSHQAWVTTIAPSQLTVGTNSYVGSNQTWNYSWTNQESSPRQAFDYICSLYGTEWEVTDALVLNVDDPATIYGSTPTIFVSPFWQGHDARFTELRATIGMAADVEDYNRQIYLVYNSGGSTQASTNGSNVYKDGLGNTLVWRRKIESSGTTDATLATAQANAQNTRFGQVRKALTIRTDSENVMADVRCGSYIYAWHPDVDVYDFTNEVLIRGNLTWPTVLRVEGITMPVTFGQGVVFVDGDGTVTDLTRYVEFESPGATLQVGAPIRNLKQVMKTQGSIPVT